MKIINALKLYFSKRKKQNLELNTSNNKNVEVEKEESIISEELHNKIIQFNYDENKNKESLDFKLKSRAREMYLLPKYKDEAIKLWNISEQSKRSLLVMIMGEFKTGKSTFINTILEEEVLKSDVTPATAVVSMISYGDKRAIRAHLIDGSIMDFPFEELKNITAEGDESKAKLREKIEYVEIFIPKDILKKITIVDTPGLNVDNDLHIKSTKRFMNEADYVYWVFSYGRAASRTEVAAIKELSNNIKPTAIINKIDEIDEEEESLEDVIHEISLRLKGTVNNIIGVSSYFAKKAILEGNNSLLEESNWSEFTKNLEENVINNSESLKAKSIKSKINSYLYELSKCASDNREELNKLKYKINNTDDYNKKLREDIKKLGLYVQASNEIRVNMQKYKVGLTEVYSLRNIDAALNEVDIDEKMRLLFELRLPLSRINEAEKEVQAIDNYKNRYEEICTKISNLIDRLNALAEKSNAIGLEVKEYERDVKRYNTSGLFGGRPLLDWNGERKKLEKWAVDINNRSRETEEKFKNDESHLKRQVEIVGILNNEIITYIANNIYPTLVKKYIELNDELDNFNEDIKKTKYSFAKIESDNERAFVIIKELEDILEEIA